MDRVDQLRRFVEASPDDPFRRYALALELKGRGDAAAAASELTALLGRAPDYLPAYLQLGNLLQSLGQIEQARETLRRGQGLAQRKGDSHTFNELSAAFEALEE